MAVEIDTLTNMWSREASISFIEKQLYESKKVSIVLVDVDFFVNIDSKVGKAEGDMILIRIGVFLKHLDRCKVGRYGGDEFILMFEDVSHYELYEYIEAIRKSFRKQRFVSNDSIYAKVPMTASFGVAHSYMGYNSTLELLKAAEIALAMAKKLGRNRIGVAPVNDMHIRYEGDISVYTIVGGGLRGYDGDGRQAFNASISEPYGVDISMNGEIIIADRGNHVVRKIDKSGIIYTIAGTGGYGYSGDGKPAIYSTLNKPSGVAVDRCGNIYIADTGNHCIRNIDTDGYMHTVAGCGEEGYYGDGGQAVKARLSRPGGVVVDDYGNIYTNDYGNNVIRKITKEGQISTVAGSGSFGYDGDGGSPLKASLNKPYGLAITKEGDMLYIADYGNNCIRQVDFHNDIINTICGTGVAGYTEEDTAADKAMLNGPYWVTVWGRDILFIADGENNCIRLCNIKYNSISTLLGNGNYGYRDGMLLNNDIQMNIPAGMAIDPIEKSLYIADYGNNAIRKAKINHIKL